MNGGCRLVMRARRPLRALSAVALSTAVVCVAALLAAAPARAEGAAPPCRAPNELLRFGYPLKRVADKLAHNEPVTIVAIGSSSTAGAGATSPSESYPSRLAVELSRLYPGRTITVLNRGANGEEAQDMLARFETSVMAENPDLVVWQVGTNSVLRSHPLATASMLIREGVRRLKASGADVVLMDLQFAPSVIAKAEAEPMVSLISGAAKEANVDLFQRFAVMRHWHQADHVPFTNFITPDDLHMNDWGYGCVAKLLGAAISDAVNRANMPAVATTRRLP